MSFSKLLKKESNSSNFWLGDLYKVKNVALFITNSYFKHSLEYELLKLRTGKCSLTYAHTPPLFTLLGSALNILYPLILRLFFSVRIEESRKDCDRQIISNFFTVL